MTSHTYLSKFLCEEIKVCPETQKTSWTFLSKFLCEEIKVYILKDIRQIAHSEVYVLKYSLSETHSLNTIVMF